MKIQFSGRKKLHRLLRQTALLAVCLVCVIASVPVTANAAITNMKGYEWTRVHSKNEMDAYADGALKSGNQILNDDSGWYRVMIIYSDDNYFVSRVNWCSSHEVYVGQPIKTTYGIKPNEDTFTTFTGLNTPYIKYAGYDGDNGCGKYFIRFSDGDKLGNTFWCMEMSWYGKAYAAAGYSEFVFPAASVSNPGASKDKRGGSLSASLVEAVSIRFAKYYYDYFSKDLTESQIMGLIRVYEYNLMTGMGIAEKADYAIQIAKQEFPQYDYSELDQTIDGKTGGALFTEYYMPMVYNYRMSGSGADVRNGCANFFYNLPGVIDRSWTPDGSEIESTKNDEGDGKGFKIYIGKEIEIPVIDSVVVEPGDAIVWKDRYITDSSVVTIPMGATLVIDGITYNNGAFIVDGGTLIVRGVLDSDVGGSEKWVNCSGFGRYLYPGSVYVRDGGTFVVEESGCYIARCGRSQLEAQNGSLIQIDGIAIVPARVAVENAMLRISNGAFLGIGLIPGDKVSQTCYNRSWIKANQTSYLASLCNQNGALAAEDISHLSDIVYASPDEMPAYDAHYLSLIEITCGGACCGMFCMENSSILCNGGIFMPEKYPVLIDESSATNVTINMNINAAISTMMSNW